MGLSYWDKSTVSGEAILPPTYSGTIYTVRQIGGSETVIIYDPVSKTSQEVTVAPKATETRRVVFDADFVYEKPDEVFASLQCIKDNRFNYGPLVPFVKYFTITVSGTNNIKSVKIGLPEEEGFEEELRELYLDDDYKIFDNLKNLEEFKNEKSAENSCGTPGTPQESSASDQVIPNQYYIFHWRPPLLYQHGAAGTEGVDYLDCRNSGYYKYYLFDPVKIVVRSFMTDDYIASFGNYTGTALESLQKKLLDRQDYWIKKGYDDFELYENDPIELREYWLTERINYLCRIGGNGETNYWPAPLHIYLTHKIDSDLKSSPDTNDYPFPSDINTIEDFEKNTFKSFILQELRWAYLYSHFKENYPSWVIEQYFGSNLDFSDAGSSIIKWDGILPKLVFRETENEQGSTTLSLARPPIKGAYVDINLEGCDAAICVGCNKHDTWKLPVEYGQVVADTINVETCTSQLGIKNIPKANAAAAINDREFRDLVQNGTRVGDEPSFPSLVRGKYFNKFFFIYIGINHEGQSGIGNNPMPAANLTGTVRLVPEMSRITEIVEAGSLQGHVEICARMTNSSVRDEQDGTILSELIFGSEEHSAYPYWFETEFKLKDMIREVETASSWKELNMAKVFLPVYGIRRFMGKHAFKSLDRINKCEIYVVDVQNTSGGSGGVCNDARGISKPGKPAGTKGGIPWGCAPFIWGRCPGGVGCPWPDFRCSYWQSPGGGGGTPGSNNQTLHFFAVFTCDPWIEEMERTRDWTYYYLPQFRYNPNWDIFTRQGEILSQVRYYIDGVNLTVYKRTVDDACSPGYRGMEGIKVRPTSAYVSIDLKELSQEDAISLFEGLTASADPAKMPTPVELYSSYAIIYTHGVASYNMNGPTYSAPAFQFGSASQSCGYPSGWDMFCYAADPGGYGGKMTITGPKHHSSTKNSAVWLFTKTTGIWQYTGRNTHFPPGTSQFDYSWWTDHWFRFINGEYQEPRYSNRSEVF